MDFTEEKGNASRLQFLTILIANVLWRLRVLLLNRNLTLYPASQKRIWYAHVAERQCAILLFARTSSFLDMPMTSPFIRKCCQACRSRLKDEINDKSVLSAVHLSKAKGDLHALSANAWVALIQANNTCYIRLYIPHLFQHTAHSDGLHCPWCRTKKPVECFFYLKRSSSTPSPCTKRLFARILNTKYKHPPPRLPVATKVFENLPWSL